MTDKVLYEKKGEVAYVTLNRPQVKNAIDLEAHHRLWEIWTDFRDDPKLRVAILTGAGDAFCSGADLGSMVSEWTGADAGLARKRLPDGFAGGITRGIHRLYKPIIAACQGWVLGGGMELALACDIRIAADDARFGFFDLKRGFHSSDGGIVRLVNICGTGIALEMVLTGGPITAQRALAVNLVSQTVPGDELLAAAEAMASRILTNDRRAVESAKETVFEVIGRTLDDQLKIECLYGYALCGGNPEVAELTEAFLNKKQGQ